MLAYVLRQKHSESTALAAIAVAAQNDGAH
jgi:hypothetical protein